jgi:hypothetical protein
MYINCNTNYKNNKNITTYNIIIIFLIFFLIFLLIFFNTNTNTKNKKKYLRNCNEYFDILENTAPPTLVKYGYLNKPISYKDVIYGKPIFYWEGLDPIPDDSNIYNLYRLIGRCTFNQDNTKADYNKRYILRFLNTSKTNSLPIDYVRFKLPIDPLTHNTVFIQVRSRDKWSSINMCICNNDTLKKPVKKILTLCNTINRDWYGNSSLIGPYNNVALNAQGYYEWLSFPISYNDIQKYKDSENYIYISLNQGLTKTTNIINPNIEIAGIATTSNPYGVYIIPASNYLLQNFEIYKTYNNIYKIYNNTNITYTIGSGQSEDDQHIIFGNDHLIKINIPVINNNCGIIIGFITYNNTWYDTNPIIYINNNFSKKYRLNNLLVGRVGMSIIGRGIYRHPRGIYLSKTFVKNNVIMSGNDINYISIIIDNNYEINGLYLRAVYSELVESDSETYIINPPPRQILYDFNNQPISYMENIYDEPIYYWEGFTDITNDLDITTRFTTITNGKINDTYYIKQWEKRTLFHFNNTSNVNNTPTDYILLKVPINPNTHNTIFLKVRARDRWTNINMYLCNKYKTPSKKILSSCSINGTNNTSNIGPFNNTALEGNYEWISFPLSKLYNTTDYIDDNNEIYVSINRAINGDENIYIAGVAVCANPYAVTTLQAVTLCWNNNGSFYRNGNTWSPGGINWNSYNNNEPLSHIDVGQIVKIRIQVLNDNKGLIIGIITHNSNWYDTNPQMYFETTPDVFYVLSPLVIGKYGFANMNRGIHRASRGFYIPAEVVKLNIKQSPTDFMYIEIIIDNSNEIHALYIRSIYTEAVEAV